MQYCSQLLVTQNIQYAGAELSGELAKRAGSFTCLLEQESANNAMRKNTSAVDNQKAAIGDGRLLLG